MSGTISTNLTPANGPGLAYTAVGENWTIAPNYLVASNDSDGVVSTFADSTLTNLGTVISGPDGDGVSFTAGGFVENGSSGLIVGGENGVAVSGGLAADFNVVINAGSIQGDLYGVGISGAGSAIFSNSGTTTSLLMGAFITVEEGARIVNSGTVEGNYIGILAFASGDDANVEIINSGTIKIGSLIPDIGAGAVYAVGASVVLTNSGTIIGAVALDGIVSGAKVTNTGTIDGATNFGSGNDRFDGAGGTQGEVHGENGDDVLIGGVDADALYGELGNDTLTGGEGADRFWFTTEPNTKTNRDTITDFSHSDGDKIVLDGDIFTGLGKNATTLKGKYFEVANKPHSKNDKIVYNEKKGILLYAENGSKTDKADWIKFANVQKGADLDHGDFLIA